MTSTATVFPVTRTRRLRPFTAVRVAGNPVTVGLKNCDKESAAQSIEVSEHMCLAIPGRVVEWTNCEPPFLSARVEFGSVTREVSLACVPDAVPGDYVLVHAGIAINSMNEQEALRVLESLREMGEGLEDEFSGEVT